MATLLRSISLKIFGIAVGLLVMMVGAALWAGVLTQQVHHQLRTLNEALFPLTLRIAELQTVITVEREAAGLADARCGPRMDARMARATALIADAQRLRGKGAELAVLERNRLELARLEPMLAELAYQHGRLVEDLRASCGIAGPSRAGAATQAREVERIVAAITREIEAFVLDGAVIVEDNQKAAMQATAFMIGVAGLVGLMLAWLVTRGLTRPIDRLRAGAIAVGEGRLDTQVPVTTRDEIGDVTQAFNTMVGELREKARITETFGQYVDPRVVSGLVASGSDGAGAGEKQTATLFFSDIAGFTALSERLAPTTLVRLMNAYFSEMSGPIRERSGVIDKYIGDSVMAFWTPPFAEPVTQAADACAAALEQLAKLGPFAARVPDLIGMRRDIPAIDIRIGIATGEVVVGSIGSDHARSFTAMGDTVNFCSRLEGANKAYGTRILIDEATRDAAGAAIEVREIDRVAVLGREEPVRIFELLGMAGDVPAARQTVSDLYDAAIAHYRGGDWISARTAFAAVLAIDPLDGPSAAMLKRVSIGGPPGGWVGVTVLDRK
jgi:class 3 adenylate cyclase